MLSLLLFLAALQVCRLCLSVACTVLLRGPAAVALYSLLGSMTALVVVPQLAFALTQMVREAE